MSDQEVEAWPESTTGWRAETHLGEVVPVVINVEERHASRPGGVPWRMPDHVEASVTFRQHTVSVSDTSIRWALAGLAEKFAKNGSRVSFLAPNEVARSEMQSELIACNKNLETLREASTRLATERALLRGFECLCAHSRGTTDGACDQCGLPRP